MHLVIAKIVAIVIFTWMAWAVWKQYVLLLNKEGKHYEKLQKYPRILAFQKVGYPLLGIYFILLVLVQIVALFSELT